MGSVSNKLRRFLTAEEVPRWFGLSVVLIYLVGLGAVARIGIAQARLEATANFQRTGRYAVELLAERLATLTRQTADEQRAAQGERQAADAVQRALQEFTLSGPARWARVVDSNGEIVAAASSAYPRPGQTAPSSGEAPAPSHPRNAPPRVSLDLRASGRNGVADPSQPGGPPLRTQTDGNHGVPPLDRRAGSEVLVRVRLEGWSPFPFVESSETPLGEGSTSGVVRSDTGETDRTGAPPPPPIPDVYYLEAGLPAQLLAVNGPAEQAGTLAIVLVVLGALFVTYRCLREQLRGVSRIADRLRCRPTLSSADLADDLRSLRIADTLDGVTTAWNELVDLTERLFEAVRRSEADQELSRVLRESNGSSLAEMFNAVPDGIVCLVDETRFEYVNAAARRLFGWNGPSPGAQSGEATPTVERPESNVQGPDLPPSALDPANNASSSPASQLPVLPEARAEGIGGKVLDVLRDALSPEGDFEARTVTLFPEESTDRNGPGSAYRVLLYPVRRGSRRGCCVTMIRDVSQQIRAERAREEFVTQVTHELRTPLTNIRAYAETLSSGMFDDPSTITECYNVITKETRRLSRLIEDVLSVSQMEVGTLELQCAPVDLKVLLGDALRDVRGLAEEKSIDLRITLPAKMEPIDADRDKLAVVLNNLLANAIKYTPPDGFVAVGCQFTADETILSIKDNGIGIDPADHARVFEKFQRGADPAVTAQTGTGIGLYTAREIVRRHRGEIQLISDKGNGSTFLVHLPRRESRARRTGGPPSGSSQGTNEREL